MYSNLVMDHFRNPRNMGEIPEADGVGQVGNPVCLPPDTPIYTNSHIRPIKTAGNDVRVLSHDGKYHRIKKVYKRPYKGKMYRLKVHNLGEISLTPEHHILALKASDFPHKFSSFHKGKCLLDWFSVAELQKGDVILYPLLKDGESVDSLQFDIEVPHWDFKSKPLPKKIMVNEEFLRLAGYYLAEGYVRTDRSKGTLGFVFGSKERNYVNEVTLLIENLFGLQSAKVEEKNNSLNVLFYSARLARFFEKLFGKGAVNKQLPHWIMTLSAEKQRSMLCGLWRGDGYLNSQKAKFVTISPQLAAQLKLLLLKQKIIFSFLTSAAKGIHKKSYSFYVQNDDSLAKLSEITGIEINLPKRIKAPKKSWFDDNFYYTTLRQIEVIPYEGFVYNLEVEKSHSFVGECATLHNCGDIMKMYIKVGKKDNQEIIEDVKFQTLGCGAAIATSSMVTEMVKGKTLSEAKEVTNRAVAEALGGLPPVKMHCSNLAADAVRAAIEDYQKKK